MITTVAEFEDGTAFELSALALLAPLPKTRPHGAVKDAVTQGIAFHMATIRSGKSVEEVLCSAPQLRPFAFGAAWKVLDLLLELALFEADRRPARNSRWTIKEKVAHALAGAGRALPLTSNAPIWLRLCALYAATHEPRHALVHRRALVDESGTVIGTMSDGSRLPPLTAAHADAFCRAVQRSASAVLCGRISDREKSDLAWQLDACAAVHGASALGGTELRPPPVIVTPLQLVDGRVVLDVPALLGSIQANWPQLQQFDVAVDLPGGVRLVGELEYAPREIVRVDPAELPFWITSEATPTP